MTRIRFTLLDRGETPANISPGDSFALTLPCIIGRAPEAQLRVIATSVGRLVVRIEEGRIEDLDSGGGSALEVDGEMIARPKCALPPRGVLWIGRAAFAVEAQPDVETL